METISKTIAVIMICFFISTGNGLFAQQDNSRKEKSNVESDQKAKGAVDSDEPEEEVVKQVRDLDVEETETDRTKTDNESMPVKETKAKALREKDSSGKAHKQEKEKIQGKEFGQSRSEQSRLKQEATSLELDESVNKGDEKIKEARIKIEAAKVKLESDRKAGKISEIEYFEKKEKIADAEKAVNDLEEKVIKAKEIKEPIDKSDAVTEE